MATTHVYSLSKRNLEKIARLSRRELFSLDKTTAAAAAPQQCNGMRGARLNMDPLLLSQIQYSFYSKQNGRIS